MNVFEIAGGTILLALGLGEVHCLGARSALAQERAESRPTKLDSASLGGRGPRLQAARGWRSLISTW